MRWWWLVLLVGCGSTETRIVFVEKDAEVIYVVIDGGANSPDGIAPPKDEAGADACVSPPTSTDLGSDDCVLEGTCPTCAEGLSYRCRATAGGIGQPKNGTQLIVNCRRFALDSALAESRYCCPPACVRSKRDDGVCPVARSNLYACPVGADGLSSVGNPRPQCSFSGTPDPASDVAKYCCE